MNRLASLVLVCLLPLVAQARLMRAWSYAELRDGADLIAIATPTKTRQTAERAPLPNIVQGDQDGKQHPVIGAGVETTFEVLAVLKGDTAVKVLVVHHYRLAEEKDMINGPGLVSFDPKQKKRFLLFLSKETDGRYRAVCGQTDPYIGIIEFSAGYP